jgi:hypothetical protein
MNSGFESSSDEMRRAAGTIHRTRPGVQSETSIWRARIGENTVPVDGNCRRIVLRRTGRRPSRPHSARSNRVHW